MEAGVYNFNSSNAYATFGASNVSTPFPYICIPFYYNLYIYLPFVLAGTFSSNTGKYSTSHKKVIFAEFSTFMKMIMRNIDPNVGNATVKYLNEIDLYQNTQQILFNLPPPRVNYYIGTNQDVIRANVVQYAAQVLYLTISILFDGLFLTTCIYRIGFNVVDVDLTVLSQLSASAIISLFLGLILNIIVFILLFLSIILIYSLLMINVETKTFEMGVMRMIGITRRGLVQLLLFQVRLNMKSKQATN